MPYLHQISALFFYKCFKMVKYDQYCKIFLVCFLFNSNKAISADKRLGYFSAKSFPLLVRNKCKSFFL